MVRQGRNEADSLAGWALPCIPLIERLGFPVGYSSGARDMMAAETRAVVLEMKRRESILVTW